MSRFWRGKFLKKGGLVTLIAWFSDFKPTLRQKDELRRIFGPLVRIHYRPERHWSTEKIVTDYHDIGADDLVVVCSLAKLVPLLDMGLKPLVTEMETCQSNHPDAQVLFSGHRSLRFVRFSRLIEVNLQTEEPLHSGRSGQVVRWFSRHRAQPEAVEVL